MTHTQSTQHEGDRGQLVNLLRVAAEPTVDLGTRHIAAITFKNAVRRRWDPSEGGALFCGVRAGACGRVWGRAGACGACGVQRWPSLLRVNCSTPRLAQMFAHSTSHLISSLASPNPLAAAGTYPPLDEADKGLVRDNMLEALLRCVPGGGIGNGGRCVWVDGG